MSEIGNFYYGARHDAGDFFHQLTSNKKDDIGQISKSSDFQKKIEKLKSINKSKKSSENKLSNREHLGTEIALKEVSEDFVKQFMAIMFNALFEASDQTFIGGVAEETFQQLYIKEAISNSLSNEMIKISDNICLELALS